MAESIHAKLSPSSATRWLGCAGSAALELALPNTTSEFAREGTAAHAVAAKCLTGGMTADFFIGEEVEGVIVTEDMAKFVQGYVDRVNAIAFTHDLFVEQRVPIDHLTGEEGAEGTSDAIIMTADGEELIVIDLKFGQGVRVDADHNEQGQIYALGALELMTLFGYTPKRVRIIIDQPRVAGGYSEWTCTVDELKAYAEKVKAGAKRCDAAVVYFKQYGEVHEKYLNPGEDQCRFCKAKADCPGLAKFVQEQVGAEFEVIASDIEATKTAHYPPVDIGKKLAVVDLIEDWCNAIRKQAHTLLIRGDEVPGYKLVQGKRGSRTWLNEQEAEAAMKGMRLKVDEMYDMKVISPTKAEKLLKDDSPRRWTKLQEYVTQSEGKPTVAPESDPRPAIVIAPVEDDFDVVTEAASIEDLC